MLKILAGILIVATLISVFVFPWPLTVVLALAAGLFWPPFTIIIGGLYDLVYAPSFGFPWWFAGSIVAAVVLHFVQQFLKTRIMSQ
jgi:hypothetical protein